MYRGYKFRNVLIVSVTSDEEGDKTVRVCVVIMGLKPEMLGKNASNADVEVEVDTQ